jgi:hypothetical protein
LGAWSSEGFRLPANDLPDGDNAEDPSLH